MQDRSFPMRRSSKQSSERSNKNTHNRCKTPPTLIMLTLSIDRYAFACFVPGGCRCCFLRRREAHIGCASSFAQMLSFHSAVLLSCKFLLFDVARPTSINAVLISVLQVSTRRVLVGCNQECICSGCCP